MVDYYAAVCVNISKYTVYPHIQIPTLATIVKVYSYKVNQTVQSICVARCV